MNSDDRANNLSLKYLRCSLLCFKDVGVRKLSFFLQNSNPYFATICMGTKKVENSCSLDISVNA